MKRYLIVLLAIIIAASLVSCGVPSENSGQSKDEEQTKKSFAIIKLTDGSLVEGDVDSFVRYGDGILKITIEGTSFYVHSSNATIIREE